MAIIKNITSGSLNEVDILGNLDVSGSLRVSGITTASQTNVLTYDTASGQIYYTASSAIGGGGSGTPAGSDTQIQFNSGSQFAATSSFKFIYTSQSLEQGESVVANGLYSHAEGQSTIAIGQYSHAEGWQTKTGTQNAYSASVVNGIVTMSAAYPDISGEFGANNRLYLYDQPFDFAYGRRILIISQSYFDSTNTIVELYDTNINTSIAYVGDIDYGISNWTGDQTIPGDYSHAEGYLTRVITGYSHAEGLQTLAIGLASHAEGGQTQAAGYASHAEGAQTKAIGEHSHAEGLLTQAIGNGSHAEGFFTIASGSYQHVQGRFNLTSSVQSAFIIGNGTDNNNRSNLIFAAGNTVEITGSLGVSGSGRFTDTLTLVNNKYLQFNYAGETTGFAIKQNTSNRLAIDNNNYGYNVLSIKDTPAISSSLGLVGIFNENPTTTLDVSGSGRFTDGLTVTGSINQFNSGSSFMLVETNNIGGTNAAGISFFSGSTYYFPAYYPHKNEFVFQYFGPVDGGGSNIQYPIMFKGSSGNVAIASFPGITVASSVPSDVRLTVGSNTGSIDPLQVGTNLNSDIIRVKYDGYVGINTSAPSHSLDVSGSGRFTNGLTVTGSIEISGSIIPATDGVSTTSSFSLGSATNAWKDIWVSNGTINFLDGVGNVQAALTSNDQGLQIENYAATTGSVPVFNISGSGNITNGLTITGSLAQGSSVVASGSYSHAEGNITQAIGEYSHAEGYNTIASGSYSHAEGNITQAIGDYSHAEGDNTRAVGNYSHAEGQEAISSGSYSHAEGYAAIASGSWSHAEGSVAQAIGNYSHAEGINTQAIGEASHAEGSYTQAIGLCSHAEGNSTMAIGDDSHTEGGNTQAIGNYSHAEGNGTQAIGEGSHTEGQSTIASGSYSHAEGLFTIASGSFQHVSGQFNQHNNDTSYFVVGIGLTEETRKDGFTVDVDANGSGSVMIPNNLDTPSVAKTGSMYVDPANNKLWIYTGNGGVSGWVTSSLG